jgi:hypothetical protein
MTKQKIDVEGILKTLAAVRKQVPDLADAPTRDTAAATTTLLAADDEATELFEMETLANALESFAGELSDSIETAQQQAMAGALEIYYAAEKLAKDPDHAHLIPYVEQMRPSIFAISGLRFRRGDGWFRLGCRRFTSNRERRGEGGLSKRRPDVWPHFAPCRSPVVLPQKNEGVTPIPSPGERSSHAAAKRPTTRAASPTARSG